MKKMLSKLQPLVFKTATTFVKTYVAPAMMSKGLDILAIAVTRAVFVDLNVTPYVKIVRFWVRENPSKVKAIPTISHKVRDASENLSSYTLVSDDERFSGVVQAQTDFIPNEPPHMFKASNLFEGIPVSSPPPPEVHPIIAFTTSPTSIPAETFGVDSIQLLHIAKNVWVVLYSSQEPVDGGKNFRLETNIKFLRKDLLCVKAWLESTGIEYARELAEEKEARKATKGPRRIEILSPENLERMIRHEVSTTQYAPDMDNLNYTKDVGEILRQNLERFYASVDTYRKFARKHKRGILLYGPPGTGKTTAIKALAGHFGTTILYVSLGTMTEEAFAKFIDNVSGRSSLFIVFEDVDAIFEKRVALSSIQNGVRFETFLNFLDGMLAPDNAVIFLTANSPEKLDAALVRDGRIDLKVAIQPWTNKETAEYISRLDPKVFTGIDLAAILGDGLFIPSSVERFCGDYLDNVVDVIPNLHKLAQKNKNTKNCGFVFS